MYICLFGIYAGKRRDAAKFVWGDRVERVKFTCSGTVMPLSRLLATCDGSSLYAGN